MNALSTSLVVLVVAAGGLAGCAPRTITTVTQVEALTTKEASLEEIMDLLHRRYKETSTVKALVQVEMMSGSPAKTQSFTAALFSELPKKIRLQGFDPLGRTLFDFLSPGEDFQLYLPDRRLLVKGTLSDMESQWLDAPFRLGDLLEAVASAGAPFVDVSLLPALEKEEAHYILHLLILEGDTARLVKRFYLERQEFRVEREVIFDSRGSPMLSIRFGDFRKVGESWRPYHVSLERMEEGTRLDVRFREVTVNAPFRPEDFTPDLAKGVEIKELGGPQ